MLQSRALWFGARMAQAITGDMCIPFLQLAAHVLANRQPLAKRINALRVVSAMLARSGTDKQLIRTVLRSVIDGMTALIEQVLVQLFLGAGLTSVTAGQRAHFGSPGAVRTAVGRRRRE